MDKNKHSIVIREYYATGEREGNYFTGVSYNDYLVSPRSFEIQFSEYRHVLDGHRMVFPGDNIITVHGEVILQMDESGNTKPVGETLYFDVTERMFPQYQRIQDVVRRIRKIRVQRYGPAGLGRRMGRVPYQPDAERVQDEDREHTFGKHIGRDRWLK